MFRYRITDWRLWLYVCLTGLLWGLTVSPAWAHGGDESIVQLKDVHVASYRLTVMTAPRVLLAGPMHVVVLVTDPTGSHFKIIQQMTVEAIPLSGGGSRQVSQAIPIPMPLGSHEAQLMLTQLGSYQIQIHLPVQLAPVNFEIEVVSGVWMQGILYVLLGITVVAALWLVKEGRTVWRSRAPFKATPA